LFAGIAAQQADFSISSPGDFVAQTEFILNEFDLFLEEDGLDRDDIVRIEFTLVEGISDADFSIILGLFASYFADVEGKPVNPALEISNTRLSFKPGGKSGAWIQTDGMPTEAEVIIKDLFGEL